MRVIQVNLAYYNGGSTGKIVDSLANSLIDKGSEAYVIYGVNRGEKKNVHACLLETRTYKRLNELRARILGNHGFNNIIATKKAIRIIREFEPDIIHLHNLHGSYINIELLFEFLAEYEKPVIWTLHDCWAFTGRCACYDFNGCHKWENGCNHCDFKKQYPSTWIVDICKKNYLRKEKIFNSVNNMVIVTPSEWLKKEISKSFLRKIQIKVINNGIDSNIFFPRMADYKEKHNIKKMMLAIAFLWTEQKGYMYIKRIAERIKKPWTLVVIGVDKKQARELRQYNVVTLPRISDDNELAKWYSTADVFINPTLEDNFPTVNIEAISCGTPCVTFDTGGAGEIIDSNTGGVIEKGNWEKMLKEAIEINKQNMQKECVKRAIDRYNREKMEKEYISLYKTMKSRG